MPTIIETAASAGNFTSLVAAIEAAGLVDTLSGPGPFTVFAPDDDAFAKVNPALLGVLLSAEGKDKLTKILTYHVVIGNYPASEVATLKSINTVAGQNLPIHTEDGVQVGEATVTAADIVVDNGTIHVIDSVLIPSGL